MTSLNDSTALIMQLMVSYDADVATEHSFCNTCDSSNSDDEFTKLIYMVAISSALYALTIVGRQVMLLGGMLPIMQFMHDLNTIKPFVWFFWSMLNEQLLDNLPVRQDYP